MVSYRLISKGLNALYQKKDDIKKGIVRTTAGKHHVITRSIFRNPKVLASLGFAVYAGSMLYDKYRAIKDEAHNYVNTQFSDAIISWKRENLEDLVLESLWDQVYSHELLYRPDELPYNDYDSFHTLAVNALDKRKSHLEKDGNEIMFRHVQRWFGKEPYSNGYNKVDQLRFSYMSRHIKNHTNTFERSMRKLFHSGSFENHLIKAQRRQLLSLIGDGIYDVDFRVKIEDIFSCRDESILSLTEKRLRDYVCSQIAQGFLHEKRKLMDYMMLEPGFLSISKEMLIRDPDALGISLYFNDEGNIDITYAKRGLDFLASMEYISHRYSPNKSLVIPQKEIVKKGLIQSQMSLTLIRLLNTYDSKREVVSDNRDLRVARMAMLYNHNLRKNLTAFSKGGSNIDNLLSDLKAAISDTSSYERALLELRLLYQTSVFDFYAHDLFISQNIKPYETKIYV